MTKSSDKSAALPQWHDLGDNCWSYRRAGTPGAVLGTVTPGDDKHNSSSLWVWELQLDSNLKRVRWGSNPTGCCQYLPRAKKVIESLCEIYGMAPKREDPIRNIAETMYDPEGDDT